ncbi:MAG: hypothetical protein P8171_00380 [Candidatus Thiodiazotropha sp.]|jgi:hypothetical protein
MKDPLALSCEELRELADTHMQELEIIIEMMIDAEVELCQDLV